MADPRFYEQVAAGLRGQITAGTLRPGDKVPPISMLTSQTGRSDHTVTKALRLLEREGMIARVPGHGYYVTGGTATRGLTEQHSPRVRVAAGLRAQIADGTVKPGDRLPSITALHRQTGLSRATIGSALRVLEQQGLIIRVSGHPYYVADRPPAQDPETPGVNSAQIADTVATISDPGYQESVAVLAARLAEGDPVAVSIADLIVTLPWPGRAKMGMPRHESRQT